MGKYLRRFLNEMQLLKSKNNLRETEIMIEIWQKLNKEKKI